MTHRLADTLTLASLKAWISVLRFLHANSQSVISNIGNIKAENDSMSFTFS